MGFENQQDRSRSVTVTEDDTPVVATFFVIGEEALVQFNLFVKAQAVDGRSMNLIYQGSVKRLKNGDTVLVGAVQQVSNRRDNGANWTVVADVANEALEVVVTGEAGVSIEWRCSLYMDWVF